MADPKKPPEKSAPDAPAEQATYQTPELDPKTGAPLDTRFTNDTSKEATASKPSPKSGSQAEVKAKNGEDEDEDEDDDETSKAKEKPRGRR
jgi:hypothetical protein